MNRRMRLLVPTAIVLAGILGALGLGLTAESRGTREAAYDAESIAVEAMTSRYGPRAPRTIEEHEAQIEPFRTRGEIPMGFGRVDGRDRAAERSGRDLPRLADTGGRESRGFIVLPPWDPDQGFSTGAGRAAAEFYLQSTALEYFDGFVFSIKKFGDEDIAQLGFDALNMSPSPGEFATDEFFSWVEVRGRAAKLVDYDEPIVAWSEASQITWIEGDTMYDITSYEGEVPVGELLRIAESLTFD